MIQITINRSIKDFIVYKVFKNENIYTHKRNGAK